MPSETEQLENLRLVAAELAVSVMDLSNAVRGLFVIAGQAGVIGGNAQALNDIRANLDNAFASAQRAFETAAGRE